MDLLLIFQFDILFSFLTDYVLKITNDSSEEVVTDWIKTHVRLPDNVYKEYEETLSSINGELLLSYHEAEQLATDARLPIGIARKIMYVCKTTEKLNDYYLYSESPKEVSDFIRGIKKIGIKEEETNFLCKEIIDKYIDGFNFRFYKDEEEFSRDFQTLDIPKLCFKKIILNRPKYFPVKRGRETKESLMTRTDSQLFVTKDFCHAKHANESSQDLPVDTEIRKKERGKELQVESMKTYEQEEDTEVLYQREGLEFDKSDSKSIKEREMYGTENDPPVCLETFDIGNICIAPNESPDVEEGKHKHADIPRENTSVKEEMENADCASVKNISEEEKDTDINIKCEILKRRMLTECKVSTIAVDCTINIAIHSNWKRPSDFERKLIFFVVSQRDEFEGNNKRKAQLWKAIIKDVSRWANEIPDKDMVNDKSQFANQCNALKLIMDVNPASLQVYKSATFIFLVSECIHILKDDKHIYKTPLSKTKRNKDFYFTFTQNQRCFFYNPEMLSSGFKSNLIEGTPNPEPSLEETERAVSKTIENESETPPLTTPREMKLQHPRKFRSSSCDIVYRKGNIFIQPEDDGTLAERCIEFKLFSKPDIVKFQKEVLRFACGCLNKRINGTIYFGIGDEKNTQNYKNGEIVGFHMMEDGENTRAKFSDNLRLGIKDCFDQPDIALDCIKNPEYVRTVQNQSEENIRFVMEVDIEPSNEKCGDKAFVVNLGKIKNICDKRIKDEGIMFLRDGSSTKCLNHFEKLEFKSTTLKRNIRNRSEFEKRNRQPKNLSSKLKHLVTAGDFSHDFNVGNTDNKYICPVLIAGKPSNDLKSDKDFQEKFSFVRHMPFFAVFDFDESSNKDGLCYHFHIPEQTVFFESDHFHKHTKNFQELAENLNLEFSKKKIWLFANGRLEFDAPHLQRGQWFSKYYAQISAAVSFLNQPFVIPKNRIIFLILLLHDDFVGLLDTLWDVIAKFGWDPIVIVAENEYIFDEFAGLIVKDGKATSDELEKHSVKGIPWAHVKQTMLQVCGREETVDYVVPSSSGTPISLNALFIETCRDIQILSRNECENGYSDTEARKKLEKTQQMQFYKGAKVTWWNFYFNNQVCPRTYLEHLTERIREKLKYPESEASVVVITIAHEAGAGATTLGHQILWEFRKEKVRCCVLRKITGSTVMQILKLWKYGEDTVNVSKPLPVLLLLDNLLQAEVSYDNFISNLKTEFRKKSDGHGMNCMVIACQRENSDSISQGKKNPNVFQVRHKLNENEQKWLWEKFEELEENRRKFGDHDPRYLISFMIMRHGFNINVIKETLTYLLYDDDICIPERKLIKYISFLSAFTPSVRRWTRLRIPVECCDYLMRRFWEIGRKSTAFNTLLIIENAEDRSEQYVRMAYPRIAKDVLQNIMAKEKIQIGEVATDFLETFFVQGKTSGTVRLRDFTLAMLKERIRIYPEGNRTAFSPLIESMKESDVNSAINLISDSYDIFHDPILAQILARLYRQQKQYDKAEEWAKISVDSSTNQSLSFCLHTYGILLREKFENTDMAGMTLETADQHLRLILESLEKFVEAQNKRDRSLDTYEAFHDTIHTINTINNFLRKIDLNLPKKDLRKYIIEREFIPDVLQGPWAEFHEKIKDMKSDGERAIDLIEDRICFYSSFDLQDSEMDVKGHRYAYLAQNYSSYLAKFSSYYGENTYNVDEDTTPLLQDAFHRGRLLNLKGHSFKTIFDHITNKEQKKEVIERLKEIRSHINAIKSTTSADLANKICVNIALGIVGGHFSKEEHIIKMCLEIIQRDQEKVELARMFLCMLMWPLEGMETIYNDHKFHEALNYLQKRKIPPSKNTEQNVNMVIVTEDKISQPIITFFKGKGTGVRSLHHRSKIFMNQKSPQIGELLQMKGIVRQSNTASPHIALENSKGRGINIHMFRKKDKELRVGEEVVFFLGFSIGGPVAYDIKHDSYLYT